MDRMDSLYRNVGRVVVLIFLLVAIMGPWTYSSDGVPPAEWCRDPNILLENERCVRLVSGAEVLRWVLGWFLRASVELVTRPMGLAVRPREFLGLFLFVMLQFLLLQPFFSTLLLILGGYRRRRWVFHVTAWGLAAVCTGLLLVVSRSSGLLSELWGIWLYFGLAAAALTLELLAQVAGAAPARD